MTPLLLVAAAAFSATPEPDEGGAVYPDARVVPPAASGSLGIAPSGWRITPLGGGHSLSLSEAAVVGPHGGTTVTTLAARVAFEEATVSVRLPFAAYRTPGGRATDLGNLAVEALYLREVDGWIHGLGVEAHVNPGGRPFTWLHRADELWPGGGVDLVYQLRVPGEAGLTWLLRGHAGVHGARAYDPVPGVFARLGGVGAVDYQLPGAPAVGLIGEAAISYWELSPFDVAGLVRVDPVQGLRARGGLVLPMAGWFGWTPASVDGGLRDLTLHLDVQMAL